MQQAEQRTGKCGDQHAGPEVAPRIDGEPAGERPGRHDAFDAEVQDTGALADQFAECSEDQRRRDADRSCPERRREQDFECVHL